MPADAEAQPDASASGAPDAEAEGEVIEMSGRTPSEQELLAKQLTSAGDVQIALSPWRAVPRTKAAELLTLAPGVFLTGNGGGHPDQIFLRGFDAREGQDLAISLEGMPLNDVGNPHGHGLVDLHFLIPEVVRTLRVEEGPFRAAQGDFAVAGSATFTLGLDEPGLTLGWSTGSFGTQRGLLTWRDDKDAGTFLAAEAYTSRGYGANRSSERASLLGRVAGGAALDQDGLGWRLLGGVSVSDYDDAGLVRRDDVAAGRIDAYGTYDPRQGGSAARAFVLGGVTRRDGDRAYSLDAFAQARAMELRDNYTGFLLDDRRAGQSPHDQRGDLLSQTYDDVMLGLRGEARRRLPPLPAPWSFLEGELVAGVFGRLDLADGASRRLRDRDGLAYRTELDAGLRQTNAAAYASAEIGLWHRLRVTGGLRLESFLYQLEDRCAHKDTWFPGAETDDVNCPDEDRFGPLLRSARRTASGQGLAPRLSVVADLWHTDADSLQATAAYGRGIRSLEAAALSDGESAPIGRITAGEAGLVVTHSGEAMWGQTRLVGFGTKVDNDLVFDETAGKNVFAGETMRWGGLLDVKLQRGGLGASASATYTYAVFGEGIPPTFQYYNSDRVPGHLIPYVPPLVVRGDATYHWLPYRGITVEHGLGLDAVSPRPLPQSERGDAVVTLDASTSVRVRGVSLGLSVDNLLDARYALAEYNFSSWFPDAQGTAFPTRVPARQVSYGPPRSVMFTLTLYPDDLIPARPKRAAQESTP